MRLNFKGKAVIGDTRIKSKFLWFPKWGDDEIRWLENATWKEIYSPFVGWVFFKWVDGAEEELVSPADLQLIVSNSCKPE